ncbi:MAG: AAA family ATPase, partial [Pseudomonadota bacterium]
MADHTASVSLTVRSGRDRDFGRGVARIDPEIMRELGASPGDLLRFGATSCHARAMPTVGDERGERAVRIDPVLRQNLGCGEGTIVDVSRAVLPRLQELLLEAPDGAAVSDTDFRFLAGRIDGIPVAAGQNLAVAVAGGRTVELKVVNTRPDSGGVIATETRVRLHREDKASGGGRALYADIGGLSKEIERLRELVELPMLRPEIFERLGITPPRGVLLHGPPGTGKTLMARAVAAEANAAFFHVSAPEIMQKFYGESEARLRELFEKAEKNLPAIVFIDEIDAIARRRDQVEGEVEKRVVAQLLTLLDGLKSRGDLVVIAATNLPNVIDPALRRPGRLDR